MRAQRTRLTVLMAMVLVAACGAPAVTPSPPASATPRPSGSATPGPTPTASPTQPTLAIGSLAVTVSDRLRVRSQPRVSDDSIRYEPLLPLGTDLLVIGGPVDASGYVWWKVEPVSFVLDNATSGWVAMADHDGEPWIAVAEGGLPGIELAMANVPRAAADPARARSASDAVNAFGLDLYRQLFLADLVKADENAVVSPSSIALALGMARAGARGTTATEMDDVLRVDGWDALGPGLNALDLALGSRNSSWTEYGDDGHRLALRIANATFGQQGWSIEPAFLDAIAQAFGSGLNLVDYAADPEAARQVINGWVKRKTAGRIPELLAPPDVTTLTRIYLVNAIYLKAEWDEWFAIDSTKPAAFTRLDGSRIDVPTMVRFSGGTGPYVPYVRGDGWQAAELRYRSAPETPQLAMTLILPDDLPRFEGSFDDTVLAAVVAALHAESAPFEVDQCPSSQDAGCYPYDLQLYLPRFSIETRADLVNPLGAAGMPSAFDPRLADFTGINTTEPLYISKVIHQANIDVDEKGTEAAAATAVGGDTGGGPMPLDQITFRLDRPFLFVLRDVETGAVLFMGRVVDPSITR